MNQNIAQISLLVADYEEAIDFYTQKLDFELLENTKMSETKRWVVIAPKNSSGCRLLLAKAVGAEQIARIGNQTGGRVFLFIYTQDFWTDYQKMVSRGVEMVRTPSEETFGTVAVFKDLYGNLFDFIQKK